MENTHAHNSGGYDRFPLLSYSQDICWQCPGCQVFHHRRLHAYSIKVRLICTYCIENIKQFAYNKQKTICCANYPYANNPENVNVFLCYMTKRRYVIWQL